MKTVFTVVIVQKGEKVLLGYKKTKIGKGYWNGFGGKVEVGETLEAAARRELYEESGLSAAAAHHCGVMTMGFEGVADLFEIHVFRVLSVTGVLRETAEMRPRWFAVADIPYEQMWEDDRHWLPLVLAGKQFELQAKFDSLSSRRMLSYHLDEVSSAAATRHVA